MAEPIAVAVMGPTASGKSGLAEELADRLDCRIVNADAFQVYRGFDVGTAKPADKSRYELLDIIEPWKPFTAGRFVQIARDICAKAAESGRDCIVAGGTGLYVRALYEEYAQMAPGDDEIREDLKRMLAEHGAQKLLQLEGVPEAEVGKNLLQNPVHLVRFLEKRRLAPPSPFQGEGRGGGSAAFPWKGKRLKIGLCLPREELVERIRKRIDVMVQNGWADETSRLVEMGASNQWPAFRAIGYSEIAAYVRGEVTLAEARERILVQTRRYAKRQMTWLRKEPDLKWLDARRSVIDLAHDAEILIREERTNSG